MNLLDLGIFIVLVLIGLRGYYRGLFQEISVIVGLLGGIVVAANFYLNLAAYLSRWLTTPLYNRMTAFLLILIGVYWVTRLVGLLLQRLLAILYLGTVDRVLGGVFALAKGALILGFLISVSGLAIPKDSRLLQESQTAPYLKDFFLHALILLPPEFKEQFKDRVRQFEKQWDQRKSRPEKSEET